MVRRWISVKKLSYGKKRLLPRSCHVVRRIDVTRLSFSKKKLHYETVMCLEKTVS